MEIKIECACGTKYKFDIEPVHGRMPMPVNCPACGADGTAQANASLRDSFASAEPVRPIPAAAAATQAAPVVRLSSPPARAAVPAAPPSLAAPIVLASAEPPQKSTGKVTALVVTGLVVLVLGLGVWRLGSRWYKRISAIAEVVQTVTGSSGGMDNSKQNFWQEDSVVLFIRHTNHLEIAEACKGYWKENVKKDMTVQQTLDDEIAEREYCIIGPHNGYIRLRGGLEWPQSQYEGLAQELSRKFKTLVFETRDVDFTGAYHFGVYEQGARKFHAQMDVKPSKDDYEEVVSTEGNEWALANGFKPGPDGFKEFHMGNADEISQKLGLKMWDENENEQLPVLLLKEL